jgi:hypothetical protein
MLGSFSNMEILANKFFMKNVIVFTKTISFYTLWL